MILSASRRTDIPSLYPEWIVNRLKEGIILVPNPRNPHHLSRITFSPSSVECIIFWSKNPAPLLPYLDEIHKIGYHFYFQFTLTNYEKEIEPGLPEKSVLVETFIRLAEKIGPERVIWRYDPILLDSLHSIEWHTEAFKHLCEKISSYTRRCILSFVDPYSHLKKIIRGLTPAEIDRIAYNLSQIAEFYQLPLFTCAESMDLSAYGIRPGACVDCDLIKKLISSPLALKKDPIQRPTCGCGESIDIGIYSTCTQGCSYCYANRSLSRAVRLREQHDPFSPILTGHPQGNELITERPCHSSLISESLFYQNFSKTRNCKRKKISCRD